MAEPPAKRARRTDSAAMWDRTESTTASVTRQLPEDSRNSKHKDDIVLDERSVRDRRRPEDRHEDRRRRSRSTERRRSRRERSQSPNMSTRTRIRDGRHERSRERTNSRREKGWDRSPGRQKSTTEARGDRGLRDRALRRSRSRSRSWSRSPARNGTGTSKRTRSPPKAPRTGREPTNRPPPNGSNVASKRHAPAEDKMDIDSRINGIKGSEDEDNDEDALLRKMMGFSTFNTTHDKKVPGNNVSGVRKEKSTKYRQYMNRTGGFNRPLSPSRD